MNNAVFCLQKQCVGIWEYTIKICQILNTGGLQGCEIKHFATGICVSKTTEILIRLLLGMQERRWGF